MKTPKFPKKEKLSEMDLINYTSELQDYTISLQEGYTSLLEESIERTDELSKWYELMHRVQTEDMSRDEILKEMERILKTH